MMFPGDNEDTIEYQMPGLIRTPAGTSTPAAGGVTMGTQPDRSRLLADLDFDDPMPVGATAREKMEEEETVWKPMRSSLRERPDAPTTSTPNLLENLSGLLRNRPTPMKPGKFDGTCSPEAF